MNVPTTTLVEQLHARQVCGFEPGDAAPTLRCASGTCWVTQAGDAVDHVLGAGDQLTLRSSGRVVVEALSDARFEVMRGATAAPAAQPGHDRAVERGQPTNQRQVLRRAANWFGVPLAHVPSERLLRAVLILLIQRGDSPP